MTATQPSDMTSMGSHLSRPRLMTSAIVPSAAHPAAQRLYRGDPTAGRQYGADLYLTARVDPPQFYIGDDGVLLASTSRSR